MSTRGTYEFQNDDGTSKFCYVHHDNYESGAAEKIWKTQFYLAENKEVSLLDAFMKMNDRAGLCESHDAHSDTEYRYTFKADQTFVAEKGTYGSKEDDYQKSWDVIYSGSAQGFVTQHLDVLTEEHPLHIDPFCMEYNQEVLNRGYDPNKQDPDGDTPLHGAARCGNLALVKLLYAHGADPEIQNAKGLTPLEATRYYDEVKDFLRENHAGLISTVQAEERGMRIPTNPPTAQLRLDI